MQYESFRRTSVGSHKVCLVHFFRLVLIVFRIRKYIQPYYIAHQMVNFWSFILSSLHFGPLFSCISLKANCHFKWVSKHVCLLVDCVRQTDRCSLHPGYISFCEATVTVRRLWTVEKCSGYFGMPVWHMPGDKIAGCFLHHLRDRVVDKH